MKYTHFQINCLSTFSRHEWKTSGRWPKAVIDKLVTRGVLVRSPRRTLLDPEIQMGYVLSDNGVEMLQRMEDRKKTIGKRWRRNRR